MLGFVEPSYVMTRLATRPGPTNVAWRLMGEFSARYVAYKIAALVIRVLCRFVILYNPFFDISEISATPWT